MPEREVCTDFSTDEIELVIARLEISDASLVFSSGHTAEPITRDDMIDNVRECNDAGKEFLEIQMKYLRAQTDGSLMKRIRDNLQNDEDDTTG